ncbi:threonine synthase [Paenibacillus cremeus]|uniref:Threonine synthase n=1 Tax=Paenibacillus cremeus TaxID=2163881 RepID=A0A559JKB7_9BACL|nr:threonine synthase [Paenibacillus cremeus]TVY00305.1 threonine synthase [Paenibacillus cremeus]
MLWSYAIKYECDRCQRHYELLQPLNTCPDCGGLLEIEYDMPAMKRDLSPSLFAGRERSLWRWHEFYPISEPGCVVTLGEGGTPLIKSVHAAKELGLSELYFKNDTLMPTGSFKDRGFSLAVSFAKQLGLTRGLTYSSGNAGSSFAAYASRAGIDATVLVEYLANPLKKALIAFYGAHTATLYFKSMDEITLMLEKAVKELGLYQFVNFINPVRHEAMKSYAYEIAEELGWCAPDVMVHPVGTGGGIWGAWKGYRELYELGWIKAKPRMVAVQPEATAPIPKAFQEGKPRADRHGDPTKTIAQSIAADSQIQGGERVLKAVYDSGGFAAAVSDEEIIEAMRLLGKDGICAEPASAAGLAAVRQAVREGTIRKDDRVVCVITGSGLKQAYLIQERIPESNLQVEASFEDLQRLLTSLWG